LKAKRKTRDELEAEAREKGLTGDDFNKYVFTRLRKQMYQKKAKTGKRHG